MKKEELIKLSQHIEDISNNYEAEPYTANIKLLKEDFDINLLNTPKHYWGVLEDLEEIQRETRLLFLFSVFNKVCSEEGKLYRFDIPYQAGMSYSAVMKKEGTFYLLDEDGDFKEIFTSENFVRFVDELYWELYD